MSLRFICVVVYHFALLYTSFHIFISELVPFFPVKCPLFSNKFYKYLAKIHKMTCCNLYFNYTKTTDKLEN